jgi:hypothetical protein
MLTTLTALNEVLQRAANLTDRDLRRAERQLGAPKAGETALGTVLNIDVQKLWAAAAAYEQDAIQRGITLKYNCDSDEQSAEVRCAQQRAVELETLARQLAWIHAKDDIGSSAWNTGHGVGLRSGWMLVGIAEDPVHAAVAGFLGRIDLGKLDL